MLRHFACLLLALAAPAVAAPVPARYTPQPYVKFTHPAWSKDAILYELNTRNFTPEGTFAAAEKQLPRLKALGVDIIWLMPIHPIGAEHRKGTLGSPYSVRDYRGVNPEFGSLADLKSFVAAAHRLGLHVILDWVANHTASDNPLHAAHPDWYDHDWKGANRPTPWWDWDDIIDLDYAQPGLRQYMTEAMVYWVREADVDGFRCDVAGYVPLDFWENARAELDRIKPVWMLAEFDQRDIHARAFDASYAWKWNNAMHDIGSGKADVTALFGYYSETASAWPAAAQRMVYTENHDQNAWEGTASERFGPNLANAIALSFIGDGIPLIHNGQEAGNPRRLKFFERDPIAWPVAAADPNAWPVAAADPNAALFKRLIVFRKSHPALANAPWGAPMTPVVNSAPTKVLSFVRQKGADKVLALFNMSGEPQQVSLGDGPFARRYRDIDGAAVTLRPNDSITLPAWTWRVFAADPGP